MYLFIQEYLCLFKTHILLGLSLPQKLLMPSHDLKAKVQILHKASRTLSTFFAQFLSIPKTLKLLPPFLFAFTETSHALYTSVLLHTY